jgi:NAD+ synthase (glutamine-hydrolysing)
MVELAVSCLGFEEMGKRLLGAEYDTRAMTARDVVNKILTCVYQSTVNSSSKTSNAASEVARSIGARFHNINVEPMVEQYVAALESSRGAKLTWKSDDLALQNIQARVRAPAAWLFANVENKLLLSTSNRSEAAVGYCTMDGDTAGSLSPIAGIDKAFLCEWLQWMEHGGGFAQMAALGVVNEQQPTAELRPTGEAQTDEKDLMPYSVLDAIERAAILDKKGPQEVFETFRDEYPRDQLLGWIQKFFRLWSRNQWKRERFALSFHLDDENLDPRSWCRFPVLSGGFEHELSELRSECARIGVKSE